MAGRKGTKPKDPDRRQRRNAGPRGLTVQPRTEMPPTVQTWLKVTKDAWEAFWASDAALLVSAKDESALMRLFEQRNLHQRLYRMVNKYPLIDGPQGRPVLNPAARLAAPTACAMQMPARPAMRA